MNKELGKPIALGRTAEIYPWEENQVLKLFHNWFGLNDIEYELRLARAVQEAGLPVPAVGDIIQVNGRNGLLYQRVEGVNMWEVLQKQPWQLFAFARQTARLHAGVHGSILKADLPSQHRRLERKIKDAATLSPGLQQAALNALSNLPEGDRLCHGDFHPGNILITRQEAVVIDWIDATRGNPLADLARTSIIMLGAAESDLITNRLMKISVRLLHAIYLRTYFHLRPGGEREYRRWLPVVAAGRLNEHIPEVEQWLLRQVRKRFNN